MWSDLIVDFDLNSNEWLRHLYEIRESWVPVFHRDTFYAGMNTTGCSESVNAFFNEFVSSKTNLREFVVRYEQTLKKIVERENNEDYVSEHKDRLIDENSLILKQAASIYTRDIFQKFREQLTDSICFKSKEGKKDDEFETYLVSAKVGWPEQFVVKLKKETYEGHCGCQCFEFMGLPCKHVLRVFNKIEVGEISLHFILKRWMRGANSFRVMDQIVKVDKYESSEAYRLSHLCRRSTQVWCVALRNEKLYKLALEGTEVLFTKILEEDSKFIQHNENQVSTSNSQKHNDDTTNKFSQAFVQDPPMIKTKSRPKDEKKKGNINSNGRLKSSIEVSSSRKKRTCAMCGSSGHDKRTCIQ
ncbi:hypothetical protein Q3G72_010053 [Acer saccharum]|nr:hypothetical protein Q3G72_010053 [Acer saccharum]